MTSTNQTVGQIALSEPAAIPVFESLGIPYCCRGEQSVEEAAEAAGISGQKLREALARAIEPCGDGRSGWIDPILEALMKHLLRSRKNVIGNGLPRIKTLVQSVAELDDQAQPNAAELAVLTETLVRDVEAHVSAETGTLFPMIQNVEIAYVGFNVTPVQPKKLRHTVGKMVHEHEEIGYLLSSMHRLTDGYQGGSSENSPYRALCNELKTLDREIRKEVHLENNVLFDRALQFSRMLWP